MAIANVTGVMFCLIFLSIFADLAASRQVTLNFTSCCTDANEATAFAIAYGLPLVAYENFTKPFLSKTGPNVLVPERSLAGPSLQNVVSENTDTLYTFIAIDLSQSDLVFTVPAITDGRYYSFPFYDPYGDNFALVSSVNRYPAGDYLLRRADDVGVQPGLQIQFAQADYVPKYTGIINFPTTYGFMNARILAFSNTTEDISKVNAYQDAMKIVATPRTVVNYFQPQAPNLTAGLLDTSSIPDQSVKALTLLARLGAYCQPTTYTDRYRVGSILGQAGISNNTYIAPTNVNISAASTAAASASDASVTATGQILTNGWALQQSSTQGNFGTDYAARYFIAIIGYQQLVSSEVLYPTYFEISAKQEQESLTADEAYLFTFYGRPPVDRTEGGFWSLTLYNEEKFLIANQLNRYAIGDRSSLFYPNGSLVYPNFNGKTEDTLDTAVNPEEVFYVLIQPQNVTPPKNWTANWLPSQVDGGDIQFILRWYAPTAAFTNGSYVYPLVQKIPAIKA